MLCMSFGEQGVTVTKYRRRNYFTRKGFQSRFILRFLVVSSIGVAIAVALFNILVYGKIDALLFSMRLPSENLSNIFIAEALGANIIAVIFVAVMFVATARGVYNRITNSLFRIRTYLSRLSKGDLTSSIVLRPDEEFKDFADELNVMISELNQRFSSVKGRLSQISRTIRQLRRKPQSPEAEALKEDVIRQIDALSDAIKEFKR